jgi:hypothetical protein
MQAWLRRQEPSSGDRYLDPLLHHPCSFQHSRAIKSLHLPIAHERPAVHEHVSHVAAARGVNEVRHSVVDWRLPGTSHVDNDDVGEFALLE